MSNKRGSSPGCQLRLKHPTGGAQVPSSRGHGGQGSSRQVSAHGSRDSCSGQADRDNGGRAGKGGNDQAVAGKGGSGLARECQASGCASEASERGREMANDLGSKWLGSASGMDADDWELDRGCDYKEVPNAPRDRTHSRRRVPAGASQQSLSNQARPGRQGKQLPNQSKQSPSQGKQPPGQRPDTGSIEDEPKVLNLRPDEEAAASARPPWWSPPRVQATLEGGVVPSQGASSASRRGAPSGQLEPTNVTPRVVRRASELDGTVSRATKPRAGRRTASAEPQMESPSPARSRVAGKHAAVPTGGTILSPGSRRGQAIAGKDRAQGQEPVEKEGGLGTPHVEGGWMGPLGGDNDRAGASHVVDMRLAQGVGHAALERGNAGEMGMGAETKIQKGSAAGFTGSGGAMVAKKASVRRRVEAMSSDYLGFGVSIGEEPKAQRGEMEGDGLQGGGAGKEHADGSVKEKVAALERENAALREQLADCSVTAGEEAVGARGEAFDRRRFRLLRMRSLQLERQVALLDSGLSGIQATADETESVLLDLSVKLRSAAKTASREPVAPHPATTAADAAVHGAAAGPASGDPAGRLDWLGSMALWAGRAAERLRDSRQLAVADAVGRREAAAKAVGRAVRQCEEGVPDRLAHLGPELADLYPALHSTSTLLRTVVLPSLADGVQSAALHQVEAVAEDVAHAANMLLTYRVGGSVGGSAENYCTQEGGGSAHREGGGGAAAAREMAARYRRRTAKVAGWTDVHGGNLRARDGREGDSEGKAAWVPMANAQAAGDTGSSTHDANDSEHGNAGSVREMCSAVSDGGGLGDEARWEPDAGYDAVPAEVPSFDEVVLVDLPSLEEVMQELVVDLEIGGIGCGDGGLNSGIKRRPGRGRRSELVGTSERVTGDPESRRPILKLDGVSLEEERRGWECGKAANQLGAIGGDRSRVGGGDRFSASGGDRSRAGGWEEQWLGLVRRKLGEILDKWRSNNEARRLQSEASAHDLATLRQLFYMQASFMSRVLEAGRSVAAVIHSRNVAGLQEAAEELEKVLRSLVELNDRPSESALRQLVAVLRRAAPSIHSLLKVISREGESGKVEKAPVPGLRGMAVPKEAISGCESGGGSLTYCALLEKQYRQEMEARLGRLRVGLRATPTPSHVQPTKH